MASTDRYARSCTVGLALMCTRGYLSPCRVEGRVMPMSHRAILAAGGQVTGNIPCYATSTGRGECTAGNQEGELRSNLKLPVD